MSRFSRYDTDEERLPEDMTRVGYDADTQVYTFQDSDGSYWESAPGCEYGRLTRVSGGDANDSDDGEPFLPGQFASGPATSWRHELMPLLNFGLLIGLSLLLLFWYLHYAAAKTDPKPTVKCPTGLSTYTIHKGDTCWDIAQEFGLSVDQLRLDNHGLVCDKLVVGSHICVPEK